ncbi:hypothetical protein ACOMCU_00160 [Lysinibacillus sp. UGB7]
MVDQLIEEDMLWKLMYWIPDVSKVSCIAKSLSEYKAFVSRLEAIGRRSNKNYLLTLRSRYINLIQDIPSAYFECEYGENESSLIGSKWITVISSIIHHLIVSKKTLICEIKIAEKMMSLPTTLEDVALLCKNICSTFEIHQRFNEEGIEYCVVIKKEDRTYSFMSENVRTLYFRIMSAH